VLCSNFRSAIVDGPFGSNLKREHYTTHGVPVLKIQNVKEFSLNSKRLDYVTVEKAEELSRHSFRNGDIVMTKLGDPLGVSAIVEEFDSGIIVADLVRIRADKVDTKFLCYQLNSPRIRRIINAQQQGATRPRVQISMVRDLPIWAPSPTEQRRIVAFLDEAFVAIATATANTERNLANARDLARHALVAKTQARSERLVRLEDVSIVDWGNTNLTKSSYVEGGPVLAVSAAGCDGRIGHAEHEAGVPVLSAIGARCGRMFFPEEPFTAIKNTITITPRAGQADGKFLYYLLSSVDLPQRGSAQPFIAKGDINKFEVPMPLLQNQVALAAEMDSMIGACDELDQISASKLGCLADLKQSLLHRAFSGELTERETLAA
jgi:type I restriction enzyme S subunit